MATAVTVSGTLEDAEGTDLTGTVTFRPTTPLVDSAGPRIIATAPVVVTLSSGAFSVTLFATDDATTSPDGATYTVTEDLTGADGAAIKRKFVCEVPSAAPTIRYEDLVEVTARPVYSYATASGLAAHINDPTDAHAASAVGVTAAPLLGGPVSTTASGALRELAGTSPLGPDALVVGDSRPFGQPISATAAAITPNLRPSDSSWFTWATFLSGGRLLHKRNASIGGRTSAQVLDALPADLDTYHPAVCFINCGTNDLGTLTAAQTVANLSACVDLCRARGVYPVIINEWPKTPGADVTNRLNKIDDIRAGVERLGREKRVDVIDAYGLLVDPATRYQNATYFVDTTHPNVLGAQRIARSAILPWLDRLGTRPGGSLILTSSDAEATNMVTGGCMSTLTGGSPNGPTGFTTTATVTDGAMLRSLVAPTASEVVGNWVRVALTAATGTTSMYQDITTGFSVGDRVAVGARLRVSDNFAGGNYYVGLSFRTAGGSEISTAQPCDAWNIAGWDGTPHLFPTVPANCATIRARLRVDAAGAAGTGTVDFGQFTLRNLSTYVDEWS
jgi:lysophospholipase L1-like esterase